jgi:LPS-assembly protein
MIRPRFTSPRLLGLLAATTCLMPASALAQAVSALSPGGTEAPSKAPVSFTADQVSYDKTGSIITASGNVRAVQNGQILTADKVTIDRTTGIVTATGHVVVTQPSGEAVYADHAVLSHGMKDAVMEGVAARLADNARLIANGARRSGDGQIEELGKVVYSACNLCKTDPRRPPTWQIKATSATRDLQHHMIEFTNPRLEFLGWPVFYAPFLTEPDPSVKRQTGLMIPSIGSTSRLGFFYAQPYFITLGRSADVLVTPIIAAKQGPALKLDFRKAFNNGKLDINLSGGRVTDAGSNGGNFGNSVFANGVFDLNDDWRAGFSYNHASNPTYLDDFGILPSSSYLASNVYLEGFSSGAYARLDAQTFQGLVASVNQTELPIVAPYGQYHFVSNQDGIGGQVHFDTNVFNIYRNIGTDTRRVMATPGYAVPFILPGGITGNARIEVVAAAYSASHLYEQPNYSTYNDASIARAQPYGAVYMSWPFIRQAGKYGAQLIEPEAQLVLSPVLGISQNPRIPNEDSLDLEFSDQNLFDYNRYPGIDRLEGGARVDYALHAAWYLPGGVNLDGLIGQSYRFHKDYVYLPGSGLEDNASDIVARATVAPAPWLNLIYRTRLSHQNLGIKMVDTTANVGTPIFNVSGGYLYTNTNPYYLYDSASPIGQVTLDPPAAYWVPRQEITAGVSTSYGGWSVSGGLQRDLKTGSFDEANATIGWQNDCFGASLIYAQRFTSFNYDNGNTLVMLQLTFKTLGNVGFNAL